MKLELSLRVIIASIISGQVGVARPIAVLPYPLAGAQVEVATGVGAALVDAITTSRLSPAPKRTATGESVTATTTMTITRSPIRGVRATQAQKRAATTSTGGTARTRMVAASPACPGCPGPRSPIVTSTATLAAS